MATEKNEMVEQSAPEKVELYIPRANYGEDPNCVIGINGKLYLLPRGKTSMVPPEVKAEYDRSLKAQNKMDKTIDRLLEAASST